METFKISSLNFKYPDAEQNTLTDISFSVKQGEFVMICGLSGSGKSTLVRQLKTCIRPYGERSGTVVFEGTEIDEVDFKIQSQKIGFVSQSPDNLSVTDKVWHELCFGLENLGLDRKVIQRRTAETASFFGMEKYFEMNVDELSGGQKQLLNLASVMIMQPSVLILDEPVSQLDPVAAGEFLSVLQKINREFGTTVIMTEHSLEDIFPLCSRVIVMSEGSIISDDTPDRTSRKLYESDNAMFLSLPSASRIYEYAEEAQAKQHTKTPLSVSDGRIWLSEWIKDREPADIRPQTPAISKNKILEVNNLWFRYDKEKNDVLKGLSFSLYQGEHLTLLGGNGTGKTTVLSVISGANRAYRGEVRVGGSNIIKTKNISKYKMALLPQNPRTLLIKDSVLDDLYEIFDGTNISPEEAEQKVRSVIRICRIETILTRHPYDLSGGEQQKAALAKILLTDPDILLLDEPSKGLDAQYKQRLAAVIGRLTQKGKSVITVSHDIEFCAKYADRCILFFNGKAVSDDEPKKFFADNEIYTSSCCRMSRGILKTPAVTEEDMLKALKLNVVQNDLNDFDDFDGGNAEPDASSPETTVKIRKHPLLRWISVVILAILFGISVFAALGTMEIPFLSDHKILSYLLMFLTALAVSLICGKGSKKLKIQKTQKSFKYTFVSIFVLMITVPLTLWAGIYFFDDKKYMFISLLIMLESMVPFYIIFEKRKVQARELVLVATMCSLCVAGRAALYMLPQFKPITALVIISGAALGSETGFLIGSASMLVSNIFFGQGVWTTWQMFTLGLIGFLSGLIFERNLLPLNKITISLFGFACAYLYGAVMNPSTLIMTGMELTKENLMSVFAYGLPMDTVHAVSTALFLFIGAEALIVKLEKIKKKYGLIR